MKQAETNQPENAALSLGFKRFELVETVARFLVGLLVFTDYYWAGVVGLVGGAISAVIYCTANRKSQDFLAAWCGLNWALFLIALIYLFGWQAGFYLNASCLVFVLFLFNHIPLKNRIVMASESIIGTLIIVGVLSLYDPFYDLPEPWLLKLNLVNFVLSIIVNLTILIYYVRRTLRHQEELAEQLLMRERLIAGLSHEMKTPLAAILTRTQVELMRDSSPGNTTEAFETIERNVRGMKRLIQKMLDISSMDSGLIQMELTAFDPTALVEDCVKLHQSLADQKQVAFQLQHAVSGEWSSDPEILRIVLNNLLSNAVRHSPKGGVVYVNCGEADAQRRISVRDEGPGIPEEQLSRLFEPFFHRSSESVDDNVYGLGLSIAQRAVELLGGRIEVQSPPGQGAKFSIHL